MKNPKISPINPDGTTDYSNVEIKANDRVPELTEKLKDVAYKDENHVSFIPAPKVMESVFKEDFFNGLLKQDFEVRNKWLDLITNPYGRIDLTNEKGEVVDWVPPISYGLVSKNQNALHQATTNHKLHHDVHASSADARLVKVISNNVMIQRPPKSHVEQWKHLIKKYSGSINTPEADSTTVTQLSNENEEYESW